MSIEVRNLVKIYGEQKAVNNISFALAKGEIVGFLGPNGAGKSTTMKILTGYLTATSGDAKVCGIDVSADPIGVKKRVGYLPESNPLYNDMYVKEYLHFIADVHKVLHKESAVRSVIELVGLTPEYKKKIGQLSKGYKQRVGLAAALVHDPEVLILDEPTTGLDPNQIGEIREVIKLQGKNKTVLFSSHILQEVEAVCNRVVIINKGQLVADDTVNNLQSVKNDQHVVSVEFGAPVDKNVFAAFSAVTRVQQLSGSSYQLFTSNAEAVRRQIMELSLQHNYNIVSLQSQTQSLETVFKNLTS